MERVPVNKEEIIKDVNNFISNEIELNKTKHEIEKIEIEITNLSKKNEYTFEEAMVIRNLEELKVDIANKIKAYEDKLSEIKTDIMKNIPIKDKWIILEIEKVNHKMIYNTKDDSFKVETQNKYLIA